MQKMRNNQTSKQSLTILFGVVLVFALLNPTNITSAQTSTEVWIDPEASEILTGETLWLDVNITGAENVNAFEIELLYDPQIVTLIKYTPGTFLSNLFQVHKHEEPGKIRLAYAQLATQPASGDGVLISFQYQGVAAGISAITIGEIILADAGSTLSTPTSSHGTVEVREEALFSPTPSRTATMTKTKTVASSASATSEPTATATLMATKTVTPLPSATPTLTITSTRFNPGQARETTAAAVITATPNPRLEGGIASQKTTMLEGEEKSLGGEEKQQPTSVGKLVADEATEEDILLVFTPTAELAEFEPQIPAGEALLETLKWVLMSFSMGGSVLLIIGFIFRSRK